MSSEKMITTAPREKLTVFLQRDKETIVAFRVRNNSEKTVVCRVNSNQKELYVVKPTRFILRSGSTKLISVRCEMDTVNDLMDTDLPTRNKLQVAAYEVDAQLEKAILSAKGSTEKEKIAATWNQIKNCPCEKVDLDVRFTNILYWSFEWILHDH